MPANVFAAVTTEFFIVIPAPILLLRVPLILKATFAPPTTVIESLPTPIIKSSPLFAVVYSDPVICNVSSESSP